MVKISVIMPVYNCENFLRNSIDSILNQTFDDLELICVDDGSTDGSLDILNSYKNDSRVKIFALKHLGGGNARNFALKHISGEYIYFMDADDILDLNAFEDFYPIAKSKNLDFLMFKAKKYDVNKELLFEHDYYSMTNLANFVKDRVFNFRDIGNLIFEINVTPWCKFYNAEFVINSKAQFKNESKFHDNQFFWDIIFQAKRIYFLDEFYYTQNIHSESLIESAGKNHCDIIDVQNGIFDLFKKHNQFNRFKSILYELKIFSLLRRYDEINDEFKELFFIKMKFDLKRLENTDFRDMLPSIGKFIFDSVLIFNKHEHFDLIKRYCYIVRDNSLNANEKMDLIKNWFDTLDKSFQRFVFQYIKNDFSNEELTQQNQNFFNRFQYKISVIIPVFNVKNYLDDAFNSLLNQTFCFENLEIIFVDDASDDTSPQIIQDYSKKYENVISLHLDKNSEYAGKPRNVGMEYATSDYLMFLDPDDVYLENACEILYENITSDDLDIVSGVHCDDYNDSDYVWYGILTNPQDDFDVRAKIVNEMIEDSNFELKINSIDEYPSVIGVANIWDKIFKKSLIKNNNITFPEGIPGEDSVFLLNALLNANGIKFINKIVLKHDYRRKGSSQHQFSKTKIIKRLEAYFQMFYLCIDKNKTDIFKEYLLVTKLRHVLVDHIMKCGLPTGDLLDILICAKPLFKLYVEYGGMIPEGLDVFEDISKGNFENALKFIQGENTLNIGEIKCICSKDISLSYCTSLSDDWLGQFEEMEPKLFVYNAFDEMEPILKYCNDNDIMAVNLNELSDDILDYEFSQFLDEINFRYIPSLKHIVMFYCLNELDDLTKIQNHFYSINYPFKHLKLITSQEYLFLSDTILISDLTNLKFGENYYFCFANLELNPNIIQHTLMENMSSNTDDDIFNKVFHSSRYWEIIYKQFNLKPKISIIVPVYNVEKYLDQCLDSICNQDFKEIEIICIDDGSDEGSSEILKRYSKNDFRFKIFSQNNSGPGSARNIGLKNASGEYIQFVDADDFLVKNTFSQLYSNVISNDSDLVLFDFCEYNENNETYVKSGIPFSKLFGDVDFDNYVFTYKDMKMHVMNTFISNWSKFYKKEFLDKYGLYFQEGIVFEDVLFQIKCYLQANRISFVPKYFYNYRVTNSNSIMHDNSKKMDIIKVVNSVEVFLKDFSYFEEFEKEFLLFKITQLSQHIVPNLEDYFMAVKNEFLQLQQICDLDNLPLETKITFDKVVNASNLEEYLLKN